MIVVISTQQQPGQPQPTVQMQWEGGDHNMARQMIATMIDHIDNQFNNGQPPPGAAAPGAARSRLIIPGMVMPTDIRNDQPGS